MKVTKIKIKDFLKIKEMELDGKSVELIGKNGSGKTSVLEAIKYALTNNSGKDVLIRQGEDESEVILETNSSLKICRKKRKDKVDYKNICEDGKNVTKPESYLNQIFTPLQLDPLEFIKLTDKEKNQILLNLIEFDWDLDWIQEKFGEIPEKVKYDQHILLVLRDIASETGVYYQKRQDYNRTIRNINANIVEIIKSIPDKYNAEKWRKYDFNLQYEKLNKIKDNNNKIQRAKIYADSYNSKLNALNSEKKSNIEFEKSMISDEKYNLQNQIDRLKSQIEQCELKLSNLDNKLSDKITIIESDFNAKKAELDKNNQIAADYANKDIIDTAELEKNINYAQEMIKHIIEYDRMMKKRSEIDCLQNKSDKLTEKLEIARNLPSEILKTAKMPIDGLTVNEKGIVLINGLPVNNLSEGEQFDLCIKIAVNTPNNLKLILLDGVEKLDDKHRNELYETCKNNGMQIIATRTTNDDELKIIYLED